MKSVIRSEYFKWLTWVGLGASIVLLVTDTSVTSALGVVGWGVGSWVHNYIRTYHNWVIETFGYDPLEK